MTERVRIGTRGSDLALWQANEAKRHLAAAGFEAELVVIKTTGDKLQTASLAAASLPRTRSTRERTSFTQLPALPASACCRRLPTTRSFPSVV